MTGNPLVQGLSKELQEVTDPLPPKIQGKDRPYDSGRVSNERCDCSSIRHNNNLQTLMKWKIASEVFGHLQLS